MIRDLFKLLRHQYIWNGDKLRLHDSDGGFAGESYVAIDGWGMGAAVRPHGLGTPSAIRRDLPQWNETLGCWTYCYGH